LSSAPNENGFQVSDGGEVVNPIHKYFDNEFLEFGIQFPTDAFATHTRGKILHEGWVIWYLFGSDKSGEYMDYYSSHRMTCDSHIRIYSDGKTKTLPTIAQMRICSEDPVVDKKLEEKYIRSNQRIARMLKKKGFDLTGDEPFAIQVNRSLHTSR
jgi:hypothetical protein